METITIPEGYQLVKVSESEYKIVPKEKVLPKTWEEFCKIYKITGNECYVASTCKINSLNESDCLTDVDKNTLPSKEKAEAILALCQLMMLRDYYNDGWSPKQSSRDSKTYVLNRSNKGHWELYTVLASYRVFSFKTKQLAVQFLDNFKDLLEKLNPLYE